jgi:hypothetical protein
LPTAKERTNYFMEGRRMGLVNTSGAKEEIKMLLETAKRGYVFEIQIPVLHPRHTDSLFLKVGLKNYCW